jgi:hypothetical protein
LTSTPASLEESELIELELVRSPFFNAVEQSMASDNEFSNERVVTKANPWEIMAIAANAMARLFSFVKAIIPKSRDRIRVAMNVAVTRVLRVIEGSLGNGGR